MTSCSCRVEAPAGFARSIPIRLIRPAGTYRLPKISPGTLVLLPENVVNIDGSIDGTRVDAAFAELARQLDTNIVVGITESEDQHFRNASIVWGPDGTRLGRYEKHHRVPFGEYIPMRNLIERLSEDARFIPRDAIAGEGPAASCPRFRLLPTNKPSARTP